MAENSAYANDIKSLTIIHAALIIGQIMFLGIAYFLVSSGNMQHDTTMTNIFLPVAAVFLAGGLFIGNRIFSTRLHAARRATDVGGKLSLYRSALITRYALLEGPSFFCIMAYMVTGSYLFTLGAFFIIGYFIFIRPTTDRIQLDLLLTPEEKEQFE